MNDEERQRTMDFILRQQAQFTVGMQKLEEADTRASRRLDRLERTLVLMARRFRRERDDIQERMAALVDAQIRTEEAGNRMEDAVTRMEDAVRSLTATTERNSNDIASLSNKADDGSDGKSS
jgi:hypothetical protein